MDCSWSFSTSAGDRKFGWLDPSSRLSSNAISAESFGGYRSGSLASRSANIPATIPRQSRNDAASSPSDGSLNGNQKFSKTSSTRATQCQSLGVGTSNTRTYPKEYIEVCISIDSHAPREMTQSLQRRITDCIHLWLGVRFQPAGEIAQHSEMR
jgi:hypothetical protein